MTEYTIRNDRTVRTDHTASAFDSDLQEIARKVAEMGGLTEKQITDAVRALLERDAELAERVIATDPTIDAMQQAARVSEFTAFMYLGELIEFDTTSKIFTTPHDQRTQDYITGRFG